MTPLPAWFWRALKIEGIVFAILLLGACTCERVQPIGPTYCEGR